MARINNRQFYLASKDYELKNGREGQSFGRSIVEYEIYKHTDVANLKLIKGYILIVKQRLMIHNENDYVPGSAPSKSYRDYPAIIQNQITIKPNNNAKLRLMKIFPRTLNTSVSTSSSSQSGDSSSTSQERSTGSTNSDVNTFGIGITAGYFAGPVGLVALSYSHSWEQGRSSQEGAGSSSSHHADRNYSDAMSIKDWSSYSNFKEDHSGVSWVWGQTFPWDVILYNESLGGNVIELPDFVQKRMLSGDLVLPPSELSLFGVDFTSQAVWYIEYPEGITEDETIIVEHTTNSFTASHELDGKEIKAKLQSLREASSAVYTTEALDLSSYSLAPISGYSSENISTIGFRADTFTYAPKKHTDSFKIISAQADLQAKGTGFDSVMVSTFQSQPTLELSFKVSDRSVNYMLLLTHWLGAKSSTCSLSWIINDLYTGSLIINPPEKTETQDNTSIISLRNIDPRSVNFHDYLVIGMNKIQIKVSQLDAKTPSQYTLSAISIG